MLIFSSTTASLIFWYLYCVDVEFTSCHNCPFRCLVYWYDDVSRCDQSQRPPCHASHLAQPTIITQPATLQRCHQPGLCHTSQVSQKVCTYQHSVCHGPWRSGTVFTFTFTIITSITIIDPQQSQTGKEWGQPASQSQPGP